MIKDSSQKCGSLHGKVVKNVAWVSIPGLALLEDCFPLRRRPFRRRTRRGAVGEWRSGEGSFRCAFEDLERARF